MFASCDICEPGAFFTYCMKKYSLLDFVLTGVIIALLAGAIYWEYVDQSQLDDIPFPPEGCNCEIYGCYAQNRVGWRVIYIGCLIASMIVSYILWTLRYPVNFFTFFIILFTFFLILYIVDAYFRHHTFKAVCDRSS